MSFTSSAFKKVKCGIVKEERRKKRLKERKSVVYAVRPTIFAIKWKISCF